MGTLLDRPAVEVRSARRGSNATTMADRACRRAIQLAGLDAGDVDLLVNVGLYHDRALGEPALAALIQQDVGINPEDPQPGRHGSFSFDVANGGCGVLSGLEVVDGFLSSGAIDRALVVASDASPGRRLAPRFPFAAAAGAVACRRSEGFGGIVGFHWERVPEDPRLVSTRVEFDGSHNRMLFERDDGFDERAAALAAKAAQAVLADHDVAADEVDLVIANPLTACFAGELASGSGIDAAKFVAVEGGERVHTAGLLVALAEAFGNGRFDAARQVLLVSAGAGLVAGAALIRK